MKPPTASDEVKAYLAEIGRKGGQRPSPHKKYDTNAERQKAWRDRQKKKKRKRVVPKKP